MTIAVGPCFGGELACVSVASALIACARADVEAVVCAIGPGVVGTGTPLRARRRRGRRGRERRRVRSGAHRSWRRGSRSADERERHRGLSHHTLAVLELVQGAVTVAWPDGLDPPGELGPVELVDASDWRGACAGLPLSHMGRGPDEEPWFFAAAYAAGALARASSRLTQRLRGEESRVNGAVRRRLVRLSFARVMRIGVAKEIKQDEYRVALTPAGAGELQAAWPRGRRRGRAPAPAAPFAMPTTRL